MKKENKYLAISIATVIIAIIYGLISEYFDIFSLFTGPFFQLAFVILIIIIIDIIIGIKRLIFKIKKKETIFTPGFFAIFIGTWNISLFIIFVIMTIMEYFAFKITSITVLIILFSSGMIFIKNMYFNNNQQNKI